MTSPCSDGRVSVVVRPLAFSSLTSLPKVKSTRDCASPLLAAVKSTSDVPETVLTLRLEAQVGLESVAGGLLPLRLTSAAAPFSTCGPSGESDHVLKLLVVHVPSAGGL